MYTCPIMYSKTAIKGRANSCLLLPQQPRTSHAEGVNYILTSRDQGLQAKVGQKQEFQVEEE